MPIEDILEETISPEEAVRRIKLFCKATGDNNPVHSDEEYARSKKFDGIIAPGLFVVAKLIERLRNYSHFHITFKRAVYPVEFPSNPEKNDSNTCIFKQKGKKKVLVELRKEKFLDEPQPIYQLPVTVDFSDDEIMKFYESIGMEPATCIPRMFLASLIPRALLNFSKGEGLYGEQELNFYHPPANCQRAIIKTSFGMPYRERSYYTYPGHASVSDESNQPLVSGNFKCILDKPIECIVSPQAIEKLINM